MLYNFTSRHQDELDLKAGYKVTVIDTSDQDWWKGKCLGRVGYFPSNYCTRLQAGEKPLQVTHNLQVNHFNQNLHYIDTDQTQLFTNLLVANTLYYYKSFCTKKIYLGT